MSTTESIASSQTSLSSWRKSDTTWTLGLFGTAIGAGVLFFPIRAGFGGLIPILVMLVLAYPIAFYCHRALARLCLSGANPSGNITETVEEHFGKTGGVVITFLYFFAICPLLWIYGVTITNTFMTFWENQPQRYRLNRSRRHSGDGMAGHLHHGVLLQLLADRLLVCGLQTRRV